MTFVRRIASARLMVALCVCFVALPGFQCFGGDRKHAARSTLTALYDEGWGGWPRSVVFLQMALPKFNSWEFWTQPVGNGAYRYVRHVPRTFMEFEALYRKSDHPLFTDRRVRRALTIAIDRSVLLSALNLPATLPIAELGGRYLPDPVQHMEHLRIEEREHR